MKNLTTKILLSLSLLTLSQWSIAPALAETLLSTEGELNRRSDATLGDGRIFDVYRFQGRSGQRVTITLESSNFDTFLYIWDYSAEEEIASNDDIASEINTNSAVTITLPRSGEYGIFVTSYASGETGRYRLTAVSNASGTGAGAATVTLRPVSQAGEWYVYEQPASVSDDQMQLAGARYYASHEACAQHYSLCRNLSGVWLSTNRALPLTPGNNTGGAAGQGFQTQSRSDFEVCMDRLMYRRLNSFDRRFAFPNSIFFYRQPTDVSDAVMEASGLRREGNDWAINGSPSVTLQVMTETEAASVCADAL